MAEGGEKTEGATPRRRQKAREKGQVARSREITALAGLLGIMLVAHFGGKNFAYNVTDTTTHFLTFGFGHDMFHALRVAMLKTLIISIPFFIAVMVLAVASDVSQVGFMVKSIEPNFGKMNPVEGVKRLFSFNGVTELLKSIMKFIAGGIIFYFVLKHNVHALPLLMTKGLNQIAAAFVSFLMQALLYGFLYLFIIAAVSFIIEKYRFEKSIMMSKEEIKEEFKESEGDPKIKSRIKGIQRELARKRMMSEVPKATVVITNPTHLAIAIRYKETEMSAPKIIAKGADVMAQKIREIAQKHDIPIYEDKPLARTLYEMDVDSFIPQELYKAVARILAYIYKLRGKL
ncbi:MAG: flagellar biosynthesis protein FlhB [Nitrospirae bacterium]|nr:flagellar biosynthesis protein FlhB [Nitrospirota bacterium]